MLIQRGQEMRNRKELIYLNIKDLTTEEKEALGDMGLNCCDNCEEIDLSEKLHWIEGEDYWDSAVAIKLVKSGVCAICDTCWVRFKSKHLEKPENVLKNVLDWYKEAPIAEMNAVEDAIQWRFPYQDVVESISYKEGKGFREIEQESEKRIEKRAKNNGMS
jgi:hypothetical protein